MDVSVIAKCTYNSETVMFAISEGSSIVVLCNIVCLRFSDLKLGSFKIRYSLPRYSSCILETDSDLEMMFACLAIANAKTVDIFVKYLCETSANNCGNKDVIEYSYESSSYSTECSVFEDQNESLGRSRIPECKPLLSNEWQSYIHHIGQKFEGGVDEFWLKLSKYALEVGFNFIYSTNDKKRVVAVCANKKLEGCSWRVYASHCEATGFFIIRTLNNIHSCSGRIRDCKSRMMRSRVVSSVVVDRIRAKPGLKPIDIVNEFKDYFGLQISYYHAWYGKELAKLDVHGDDSKSFNELVWYVNALNETNPGSVCDIQFDRSTHRFQRFFISFGGCIAGFPYCLPLLFIDAAFLKSKYKGQLLCACGKNGNQGFYPLAFAFVDSETEDNWTWFLNHLSSILVPMGRVVTFFSDRNQGLLKSMDIVFPSWPHSYCYFHLKQNLISKYPKSGFGKLLQEKVLKLFARCAFVVRESEFQDTMDELLVVGSAKVKSFIADLSKEHYANAYFDGKRYGETANSLAESFNNWIGELRQLPVLPLIDGLRKKLMVMNSNRSIESEKWTTILCPLMEKDLKNKVEVGRTWNVRRSSSKIFEVCGDVSVMVDCESRTCSCRLWKINGFPCTHAVAAILGNRESVYDYVECYFKYEFFRKAYESPVFPIPDIGKGLGNRGSVSSVILPPITKRPAGRPPTKRIKSAAEATRPLKCSRCGVACHNKKTCKAVI